MELGPAEVPLRSVFCPHGDLGSSLTSVPDLQAQNDDTKLVLGSARGVLCKHRPVTFQGSVNWGPAGSFPH